MDDPSNWPQPGAHVPHLDLADGLQRLAEQKRMAAEAAGIEIAMRRSVLRWTPVLCGCRFPAWPVRGDTSPPQAGCVVHGGIMVAPDGSEVL